MSEARATDAAAPPLVLTTNPGLEGIAFAELRERVAAAGGDPDAIGRAPGRIRGRVGITGTLPAAQLEAAALGLRSVHNLLVPVTETRLTAEDPLAAVHRAVAAAHIPELADGTRSFRVSSRRRGDHGFTSVDVERTAGAAVVAATGAPVDLEHYDVELRVDVIDDLCAVAVRRTRTALSHRHERPYRQRVSLKPNVAYAALRLAGVGPETRHLLDPFCGAGTILMEAGELWPDLRLWGGDRDRRAAAGARENLAAAGLAERATVLEGDAMRIDQHVPAGEIDAIVTNPPYGRKIGRSIKDYPGFYRRLLEVSAEVLPPGGRLAFLGDRKGAVRRAARTVPTMRAVRARVIQMSGVWPAIFVFERR